ncbi:hypothetical protein K491DRAFT_12889 [Lophiostoma macrostomum CBS 122681]|uniref:Protein kinase domain-containing protein n=1 Tax=Lophiostoma macrostomum CBS 122681 TaxID=1314788 RepID=A0A6A6TSI8_9PLEO|nr:hypothetical protein K491DRAFT_12889 [Lophiostoma macrostomum CBS 122681]
MSVEIAGLGLAVADLAIKYGRELVEFYSSFKEANKKAVQDQVLTIQNIWYKTQHQIEFLGHIWNTLDADFQVHLEEVLDRLANGMQVAWSQVQRVERKKRIFQEGILKINRLKYAFIKESIDKAVAELQHWQQSFDPSWTLMLRSSNPQIDQQINKNLSYDQSNQKASSVILKARNTRRSLNMEMQDEPGLSLHKDIGVQEMIPHSCAKLSQRTKTSVTKQYIVDSIPLLPEVDSQILAKDVRDLARRLRAVDPLTFGLLQCRGFYKEMDDERRSLASFDLVFTIPTGLRNPKSLRHILLSPDPDTSLSDRFRVAQQLAQAVSYVHTYGFVHKGIRPDTILIFEDRTSSLAASFLVGFESMRTENGRTLKAGDSVWEKDIYRHPLRQGLKPEVAYIMQHDIYSLGVCLLEIGLWESFVLYQNEAIPSHLLPPFIDEEAEEVAKATRIKDSLVGLARKKLPGRMGDKYTDVVVNCLTCLDEDNIDFGNERDFEDEDGILIGVRYIEKVLLRLNDVSL